MDTKKGFIYSGIAAISGTAGYLLGRSKSIRGLSLTLLCISTMLYLPRGCQLAETYMKTKADLEKSKMLIEIRKDSLDEVVNLEKMKRDSMYNVYKSRYVQDQMYIQHMITDLSDDTQRLNKIYDNFSKQRKDFEQSLKKEDSIKKAAEEKYDKLHSRKHH